MIRRALILGAILLAAPWVAVPVSASDVNLVVIAFGVNWHIASTSTPPKPTIIISPGDALRLQVHNHDAMNHTFTFPHFGVDLQLAPGSDAVPTIAYVNITTSTADNGKWQFYCSVPGHTTGTDPNRDGMVGWVQVGSTPPTPGLEVPLILAVLGIAAVSARRFAWRKR
ncbi:MAG: hypothetical protein E6K10_08315 [Methanobacteriota archaeon]|nr:MAG: hypothetical protein E6K10_08315 [Euryarchaeota archaeon]